MSDTSKPTVMNETTKTALECKNQGNAAMGGKDFAAAVAAYDEGIKKLCSTSPTASELDLHIILLANRAQAYLELQQWHLAEQDCTAAIALKPHAPFVKALFRRCAARIEISTPASLSGAYEDAVNLVEAGPEWYRDGEQLFSRLKALSARFPITPKLSFRNRALARHRRGTATTSGFSGTLAESQYADGSKNVRRIDHGAGRPQLVSGIEHSDDGDESDHDDTPADLADNSQRILFFGAEDFLRHPFDWPFVQRKWKPVQVFDVDRMVRLLSMSLDERERLGPRAASVAIIHNAAGTADARVMAAAKIFFQHSMVIVVGDCDNTQMAAFGVTWRRGTYTRLTADPDPRARHCLPASVSHSICWKGMYLAPGSVRPDEALLTTKEQKMGSLVLRDTVAAGQVAAAFYHSQPSALLYVADCNNEDSSVELIVAMMENYLAVSEQLRRMYPEMSRRVLTHPDEVARVGDGDASPSSLLQMAMMQMAADEKRAAAAAKK